MKKKQLATSVVACALVGAMAVGGTVAYLTDGETTTNTFTVGKVQVDLEEPHKPGPDTPRVPNEEMEKDPTVQNTGNNKSIVFVAVDIPMDNLVIADSTGKKQDAADVELFDFRAKDDVYDSVNDGWVEISSDIAADKSKRTYIYGFEDVLDADEKAPSLFDFVRMANIVEGQIDEKQLHMPIRAYSIQADFLQNSDNTTENDNIVVGDGMNKDTLTQIYNIFAAQNSEAVAGDGKTEDFTMDDADTEGKFDLEGIEIEQAAEDGE